MTRRMACSLTVDAVRSGQKTVTRRALGSWRNLAPGDRLTLIVKGMGLKRGEQQEKLAEVEVTAVDDVELGSITLDDIAAEGFSIQQWTPETWVAWYISEHSGKLTPSSYVRRIEWRYLGFYDPPEAVAGFDAHGPDIGFRQRYREVAS